MNQDRLHKFVEADTKIKVLESSLDYWKIQRRAAEEYLLDEFGMEGVTNALIEHAETDYKVYTRHTQRLAVINLPLALASLRINGLGAFIDEEIDTAKLGSYYKKHPVAFIPEGMEMIDTYKLYAIRKK